VEEGKLRIYSFRRRARIMQKVQKASTPEFKREEVRLAQTSGKAIEQMARELGISDTRIHQKRELQDIHLAVASVVSCVDKG